MRKYDKWDGHIPIEKMTDLHLLHAIRKLMEGKMKFGIIYDISSQMSSDADLPANLPGDDFTSDDIPKVEMLEGEALDKERMNWLVVLQGEALKRGLDWTKPPSRKVGILEFLCQKIRESGYDEKRTFDKAKRILQAHHITEPEIDVNNLTGLPSYMHWKVGTGKGKGTPIEKPPDIKDYL
jgi:hypothetical protein